MTDKGFKAQYIYLTVARHIGPELNCLGTTHISFHFFLFGLAGPKCYLSYVSETAAFVWPVKV